MALAESHNHRIKSVPVTPQKTLGSSITPLDGIRYLLDVVALADRHRSEPGRSYFFFLFLLGLGIAFLVFGWTLVYGYFFSDDFTWLWHGFKINGSWPEILRARMSTFYSPVLNAFYTLLFPVFQFSAWAYFLIGLLVHAACAGLAGTLAFKLSRSRLAGILATLLFAVCGGAYEPLVWIGANMHSIAVLFILSSLVSYYAYLERGKASWFVISFLTLVLALGTKEISVVGPALLVALFGYRYITKQTLRLNLPHGIFLASIFSLTLTYLIKQYFWQKSGIWITESVWKIDWHYLVRLPLVIIDLFVPLKWLLKSGSALFLEIVSTLILGWTAWRYNKLPIVWFGLAWILITVLPTIFFKPEYWFDPLASRYEYLPRIGSILMIVGIFIYHVSHNTARRVINGFALALILISIVQIIFMAETVSAEYDYVYASGRTLVQAVKEISPTASKVYIQWDHPFTNNHAHIVGVLQIINKIPESKIVFLDKDEKAVMVQNEVVLYWDALRREYHIK
ncbi:MAG: hypothetical protein V1821_02210 [bacterium]